MAKHSDYVLLYEYVVDQLISVTRFCG